MNLKNISISAQLKLGFAIVLLLVVALGVVSYLQTDRLYEQIDTMYNHPLQVRRAIGKLSSNIIAIQRDMKDLFLAADEKEIALDLDRIETSKASAFAQIDILYSQFLGSRTDLDSLNQDFIVWNSMREETIRLFREGRREEAVNRTRTFGTGGLQAECLLAALEKIDDFARKKGDLLYANSVDLKNELNRRLLMLVAAILLLSVFINYIVLRNIRRPLNELADVTRRFRNGEKQARSSYALHNEFGILSDSFNTMVADIQAKAELDEKVAHLAGLMLSEYDTKKFFQATLNALATHTGSQMAAIYLLNDEKKQFVHFESTGVDNNARQSFAADTFEGEFGAALSSRKVQHIKEIPENTRFVFHTVSGTFIPREIITLPILADNKVIAVISLASVNNYGKQSIQLIDTILVTLCARIEGIMAYHRIKEFTDQLKTQNSELHAQQSELAAQSAELAAQNSELEMQTRQLEDASRLKTTFLSNMSHELRTPLNSVIALSGVLHRRLVGKLPDEEYGYLEVIERNGKMLLALINDILDISRIESGREEFEIERFDADTLIADIVAMIQPQAEQKNIALSHRKSAVAVGIESDIEKCRHILQNIIANAVKFTEKGSVDVVIQQTGSFVEIAVTDTGIGIAESFLPYIFDEFRQADGSTSRRFGGTGLGLAIAKKYATLLGGSIGIRSELNKGSTFTLRLPLHSASTKTVGPAPELRKPPQRSITEPVAGTKTILLVDDSEPAIIQMRDILAEQGYRILIAHDGSEALSSIETNLPDAIVLDLTMPGIDGFTVLKTVRDAERTAHVPVLILTAKQITKEELRFLKRNNIHQLIQKGDVNREELLDAVAAMVTVARPVRQAIIGKPIVLIVEDNPDNMLTMQALLAEDFTLLEATDGHAGVAIAKSRKPHLILMDIGLPEKDGVEAFKELRRNAGTANIPVIAVTASAMNNDREAILAYGFDAYIAKPIDNRQLLKCIGEVLYGK
jgi:signal transduction histidine kinase/DNA-binding response OmpR family regulator/HAMP domain-containing protein